MPKFIYFASKSNIKTKHPFPINNLKFIGVNQDNSGYLASFIATSTKDFNITYNLQIWTDFKNLSSESSIKFYCSCENFKYRYSAILNKHNNLYGNLLVDKLPKKPVIGVCKHINAAIIFLRKYNNLEQLIRK